MLAISFAAFALLELAPGDFLDHMRLNPQISEETLRALRSDYGLDRPFLIRYGKWLRGIADGSWGFSFAYGDQVAPLLFRRALNTLTLGVTAAVSAWLLAVPVGIFCAVRKGLLEKLLRLTTSWTLGTPEIVISLLLLLVAERSGVFPIGGMTSHGLQDSGWLARAKDMLWHLVLPATALALPAFAVVVRHVKRETEDALQQPFVRNARALGIGGRRLLVQYALRPAANPLIVLAGLSVSSLLSASLIVEVVMGWPGLGPFLLEAILGRDIHVVIGGVVLSAVFVIMGGLFADLLLFWSSARKTVG